MSSNTGGLFKGNKQCPYKTLWTLSSSLLWPTGHVVQTMSSKTYAPPKDQNGRHSFYSCFHTSWDLTSCNITLAWGGETIWATKCNQFRVYQTTTNKVITTPPHGPSPSLPASLRQLRQQLTDYSYGKTPSITTRIALREVQAMLQKHYSGLDSDSVGKSPNTYTQILNWTKVHDVTKSTFYRLFASLTFLHPWWIHIKRLMNIYSAQGYL